MNLSAHIALPQNEQSLVVAACAQQGGWRWSWLTAGVSPSA
jgi:hypothetical protein